MTPRNRTRLITFGSSSAESFFLQTVELLQDIGYGRMMQLISEHWRQKDPFGALTVGPCYGDPIADDRASLRAENEAMREAVQRVLDLEGKGTCAYPTAENAAAFYCALQDLRAALARKR